MSKQSRDEERRARGLAQHRSGLRPRAARHNPIALLAWAGGWGVVALVCLIGSTGHARLPFLDPDDLRTTLRTFAAAAAGAAAVVAMKALASWDDFRRSRSRAAVHASQPLTPENTRAAPTARAGQVPDLVVRRLHPRQLDGDPQPVSDRANVVGNPPVDIVYLRLFENEAGSRRFMEGAWREFGQVTLLKTSESLTRAELSAVDDLLVGNTQQLEQVRYRPRPAALGPGLRTVTDGTRGLLVRDPFGSYPVRSLLCTNAFWMTAVESLVRRADLTVLDLTGFSDQSKGTARELQLIIDRVPLHRVLLLKDRSSDTNYLVAHIRRAWARMAVRSPNATGPNAIAVFAVAENLIAPDSSVLASRGRSRRLAAAALDIAAGRLVVDDDSRSPDG